MFDDIRKPHDEYCLLLARQTVLIKKNFKGKVILNYCANMLTRFTFKYFPSSVGLKSIGFIIDLTPEGECDGNAFWSVCLSVRLSVYTGEASN